MQPFGQIGERHPIVMDEAADGLDDANVLVGVLGEAAPADGGREDALFAPAIDGVAADVELAGELVDAVHDLEQRHNQFSGGVLFEGAGIDGSFSGGNLQAVAIASANKGDRQILFSKDNDVCVFDCQLNSLYERLLILAILYGPY